MRVLLCHDHYRSSAPSGEDAVFQNEHKLLAQYGSEVITFERFNDDIDESTLFNRINLAIATAWSRPAYKDIAEVIRKERPDIAHFHNTFPLISPSAYVACQRMGVPVVQTLHNYRLVCPGALLLRDGRPCEDCLGGSLFPALRHRCYRDSLGATAALAGMLAFNRLRHTYQSAVSSYIALTEFAAGRLQLGGLPASRITVKPNFLPNPPPPGPGGGGYAVYVGRLSSEKGIRTLLTAWQCVRGLHLKILGDGPLRPELEATLRAGKIDAEFLGSRRRGEVLDIVSRAELQIIPSEWYEGFPMVVLEAYACGTPIIASRIGSLEEIVLEGKTGFTFEPGDAQHLAEKVNRLLADRGRLAAMRAGTRDEFDRKYTAERNYAMLTDVYDKAVASFSTCRGNREI